MSDHDSEDEGHEGLQDDFFTEEEAFVSTHQEALLDCYELVQERLQEGGHPVLDRCSFPQFCSFVWVLSECIAANGRALRSKLDPVPWGLLEEDDGGAPEPDSRYIRRMLGREMWIHAHKHALLGAYDDLMVAMFPKVWPVEGYMRQFADFCFRRSSMTLSRPKAPSI